MTSVYTPAFAFYYKRRNTLSVYFRTSISISMRHAKAGGGLTVDQLQRFHAKK